MNKRLSPATVRWCPMSIKYIELQGFKFIPNSFLPLKGVRDIKNIKDGLITTNTIWGKKQRQERLNTCTNESRFTYLTLDNGQLHVSFDVSIKEMEKLLSEMKKTAKKHVRFYKNFNNELSFFVHTPSLGKRPRRTKRK